MLNALRDLKPEGGVYENGLCPKLISIVEFNSEIAGWNVPLKPV